MGEKVLYKFMDPSIEDLMFAVFCKEEDGHGFKTFRRNSLRIMIVDKFMRVGDVVLMRLPVLVTSLKYAENFVPTRYTGIRMWSYQFQNVSLREACTLFLRTVMLDDDAPDVTVISTDRSKSRPYFAEVMDGGFDPELIDVSEDQLLKPGAYWHPKV